MMSDDFIEEVISSEVEMENARMINREFYGMESVAQYDEENESEDGGDE